MGEIGAGRKTSKSPPALCAAHTAGAIINPFIQLLCNLTPCNTSSLKMFVLLCYAEILSQEFVVGTELADSHNGTR